MCYSPTDASNALKVALAYGEALYEISAARRVRQGCLRDVLGQPIAKRFSARSAAAYTRVMTRQELCLLGPILIAAAVSGCTARVPSGGEAPVKLDVIFVATDLTIVNAMVTLAGVTRDDVVYDLGCGDGRIVIAAAKEFGARGVGVDLDPQRIREAQANAARGGVADRVTFRVEDVFDTAIQSATVVTLFLSPELNARLRPKLTSQLRPGTRIVSHRYGIGDWVPEQTRTVTVSETRNCCVFPWRVP
jgi:SAM-dependent methyltransferase